MIEPTKDAVEYMAGALRTVVAMAKEKKDHGEIKAVAQAGLDLAELGEKGCAEMRGDDIEEGFDAGEWNNIP